MGSVARHAGHREVPRFEDGHANRARKMDSVSAATAIDIVALTRGLVDIDSTTGREGDAGRWLAAYLRDLGLRVIEQPVDEHRCNVIATTGTPAVVVLSTHFDCVPPFFSSRIEGGRIYGRGSCD